MIIADSSPLIFLVRLQLLDAFLARHRGEVVAPMQVVQEICRRMDRGGREVFAACRSGQLRCSEPKDEALVARLSARAGVGEAAAVVLAAERGARLLVDDAKGRGLAAAFEVEAFGTLAVLIALHHAGDVPDLKRTLNRLQRLGFYISEPLRARILREQR